MDVPLECDITTSGEMRGQVNLVQNIRGNSQTTQAAVKARPGSRFWTAPGNERTAWSHVPVQVYKGQAGKLWQEEPQESSRHIEPYLLEKFGRGEKGYQNHRRKRAETLLIYHSAREEKHEENLAEEGKRGVIVVWRQGERIRGFGGIQDAQKQSATKPPTNTSWRSRILPPSNW